jgi:MraZ protein
VARAKKQAERLIGDYTTVLDSKGRVGLGRFRQYFGDSVIALRLTDHLVVLKPDQFDLVSGGIRKKTAFDSEENVYKFFDLEMQLFKRHFYSNAFEISLDAQGRLTVPKKLRSKLGLVEDVVWVGCGDRLELWEADKYKEDCVIWEYKGGPARVATMLSAPTPGAAHEEGGPDVQPERDQE